MGYINVDQCDCCKEIWNRTNIHHVPLQNRTLILCDECLSEFKHCFIDTHKIDLAIAENKAIEFNYKGKRYGLAVTEVKTEGEAQDADSN